MYIDGELKKVVTMKAPNFSDVRNMYTYIVCTIGFVVLATVTVHNIHIQTPSLLSGKPIC